MIETIQVNEDILAICISAGGAGEGTTFFSPDHFPFQVGLMKRGAGYRVAAHVHTHQERHIRCYQEVLFVRTGKIRVELYDQKNQFAASRILAAGDCILFAAGGHGVEVIEEAEVLEVKQGPFMGDDKVFIAKQV